MEEDACCNFEKEKKDEGHRIEYARRCFSDQSYYLTGIRGCLQDTIK